MTSLHYEKKDQRQENIMASFVMPRMQETYVTTNQISKNIDTVQVEQYFNFEGRVQFTKKKSL